MKQSYWNLIYKKWKTRYLDFDLVYCESFKGTHSKYQQVVFVSLQLQSCSKSELITNTGDLLIKFNEVCACLSLLILQCISHVRNYGHSFADPQETNWLLCVPTYPCWFYKVQKWTYYWVLIKTLYLHSTGHHIWLDYG